MRFGKVDTDDTDDKDNEDDLDDVDDVDGFSTLSMDYNTAKDDSDDTGSLEAPMTALPTKAPLYDFKSHLSALEYLGFARDMYLEYSSGEEDNGGGDILATETLGSAVIAITKEPKDMQLWFIRTTFIMLQMLGDRVDADAIMQVYIRCGLPSEQALVTELLKVDPSSNADMAVLMLHVLDVFPLRHLLTLEPTVRDIAQRFLTCSHTAKDAARLLRSILMAARVTHTDSCATIVTQACLEVAKTGSIYALVPLRMHAQDLALTGDALESHMYLASVVLSSNLIGPSAVIGLLYVWAVLHGRGEDVWSRLLSADRGTLVLQLLVEAARTDSKSSDQALRAITDLMASFWTHPALWTDSTYIAATVFQFQANSMLEELEYDAHSFDATLYIESWTRACTAVMPHINEDSRSRLAPIFEIVFRMVRLFPFSKPPTEIANCAAALGFMFFN